MTSWHVQWILWGWGLFMCVFEWHCCVYLVLAIDTVQVQVLVMKSRVSCCQVEWMTLVRCHDWSQVHVLVNTGIFVPYFCYLWYLVQSCRSPENILSNVQKLHCVVYLSSCNVILAERCQYCGDVCKVFTTVFYHKSSKPLWHSKLLTLCIKLEKNVMVVL